MFKECQSPTPRKKKRKIPPSPAHKKLPAGEPGLSPKEAIQEAERCLGLRGCDSCDLCALLCPELCVTRDGKTGEVRIDLDYCKGCGICAAVCPKAAIQMVLEKEE
jgi:2-oxoacid:acceptor oxidoreductase delta subunit (pyruvate/2-ketoisovalerate family)